MKKKFVAAVGVAALAALLTLGVGAGSASAHTPSATISCDTAIVSLHDYDRGATATVTVDGKQVQNGTFGGRYDLLVNFAAQPNLNHSLVVHVVSQDGAKYNYDFAKSVTNCPLPPAPPIPADKVTHNTVADCKTDTATDFTYTTSYSWQYNPVTNSYDQIVTGPIETKVTRPATPEECPPVSTPTPTPTTTPGPPPVKPHHPVPPVRHAVVQKLAYTGGTIAPWEYPTLAVTLGLGGLFLFLHLRKRNKVA